MPRTWELIAHSTTPTGITLLTYRRGGDVEIGYVGPDQD
jgi:hypothetical protein